MISGLALFFGENYRDPLRQGEDVPEDDRRKGSPGLCPADPWFALCGSTYPGWSPV
jgi:hypothetical protein